MDAQKQMHVFDHRLFLAGVGSLSLLAASSAAAQTTASGQELRQLLAEFVVAFDVRRVPADVIELARLAFIDSIGVAVAGSHEKVAHIAADIVRMEGATQQCTIIGQSLRTSPQLAAFANGVSAHSMDYDFTYTTFPKDHWTKIDSNNPIERLDGEIKRRTNVVGVFPNEGAIFRLVGAILLEQNDEWAVQRGRYMTLETIAPLSHTPFVGLPAVAT